MPNGLSSAPRIFTKLLKPLFSSLRKLGHENVVHIDDSLLSSESRHECVSNIKHTIKLIDSLGLTVHPDKSVFTPTRVIEFIGFVLDSVNMTVSIRRKKGEDIKLHCLRVLKNPNLSIRDFSKLTGKLVATEPGVKYAPLHYKPLEMQRDNELKNNKGHFDAVITLSQESITSLNWWVNNIQTACKPISAKKPSRKIESDSSLTGYGGYDVTNNSFTSGKWVGEDKNHHINYLELKAAFLCLKSFCAKTINEHIQLFLDNTVAIQYLAKMGGRKPLLNKLAREIWLWCEGKNLWLSVYHIPGKLNKTADGLSRMTGKLSDDMEWSLNSGVFKIIEGKMGKCYIDLFVSSNNFKLPKYVSFLPDPKAIAVNAFSLTWTNELNYIFSPFSMIGPVLKKIWEDKAEVILVAPLFSTQPWFPQLLRLISGPNYILPKVKDLLSLPHKKTIH